MTGVHGIGVGRVRTVPLFGDAPEQRPAETDAVFAARVKHWERWQGVSVVVRRQSRKLVRLRQFEVQALEQGLAELDGPELLARADELRGRLRDFLAEPVKHPVTGVELGSVLVRVTGIVVEEADGSTLELGSIEHMPTLFLYLEELDLLETVTVAAFRAQEPTRAEGN